MGLPLFITPVEPEVGIKAVEKSAGGPRSAIRRHRALRGFNSPAHQREAARRRRILSTGAEASLEEEYEIWDMRRASSGQNGTRDVTITNRRGGQYSQRVVADQERLRATVLSERRNRSYEPDGSSMMPPVPETRDYYTVRGESDRLRQPSDLQRLARNSAPTPPYTETDLAFLARRPSASPRPSSLNESARPVRRLLGRRPVGFTLREQILAANREIFADGLGDRDRSLSPEGDSAWDTLRASIAPDPQPPSGGSSFASTAAAASSSTGSAVTSTGTSMTSAVPSEGVSGVRDCDNSDSECTDEDEEEMYGLQEFTRSRGDHLRRSYAETVSSRPQPSRNDDEVDWAAMRRIITSLVERDDVPEEWWSSTGLTRNLRHEPMS